MYKMIPKIVPHSALDALIYAVRILSTSNSTSMLSPCGAMEIEILDLSDEEGGVHLSIDILKGNTRLNVLGVHWPEHTPDIINYNNADTNWFPILEDWFDRTARVGVEQV